MPTGHPANVDEAEIVRLYLAGMSCNQIAKQLGVSEGVPYGRLKRAGIPFRDRSTALKGRNPRTGKHAMATLTCTFCGIEKEVLAHEAKVQRFCSLRCASRYAAQHDGKPRQGPRVTLLCPTCGRPFDVLPHIAKSKPTRYCSRACMHYTEHLKRRSGQKRTLERIVEAMLIGMAVPHICQWQFGTYTADFYVPSARTAIECDGDYWHALPITVRTDLSKEAAFRAAGIPVLHLTESEVYADLHAVLARVQTHLVHSSSHATGTPSSANSANP